MKVLKTSRTVLIKVLGCKVNQAEAASMAQVLAAQGYVIEPGTGQPDLVLINTCCVTSKAESKSKKLIAKLATKHPSARFVITGCLAEANPDALRRVPENSLILGTYEKDNLRRYVDGESCFAAGTIVGGASLCTQFPDLEIGQIPGRSRALVKVQDGCSQNCSYCVVPKARGPNRSLPIKNVVTHVATLADLGVLEVVITGIHLGSYGKDLSPPVSLEELLENLTAKCPGVRYRLSSIEPQNLTQGLIEMASSSHLFCRHFHIPVQSGDDGILQTMGRPYDSAFVLDLSTEIFMKIPEACIGFDIMVGFPGEKESAFSNTLTLIKKCGPAYLHVFPFSPRPETPASVMQPRVSESVSQSRVRELRTLSIALRGTFFSRCLNKIFTAVPEFTLGQTGGLTTVRTDNYIPVNINSGRDSTSLLPIEVKLENIINGKVYGVRV